MSKLKNNKNLYEQIFDRVSIVKEPKILFKDEEFSLDSKYYTNKDQSIILRSNNETGKIIKKKF